MGYNITKSGDNTSIYVTELIADSKEDVQSLPTHYAPGSSCLVIGPPACVFMLNSEKKWVELE